MKPLHVGLLVVGAALAGGLAMKMTQPVPPAAAPAPKYVAAAPPPQVQPVPEVQPSEAKPTAAPPPVFEQPVQAVPPAPVSKHVAKTAAAPAHGSAPVRVPLAAVHATPLVPRQYEAPLIQPTVSAPAPSLPVAAAPAPVEEAVKRPEPEPVPVPAPRVPRQVTLHAGTTVPVRLLQTISGDHAVAGDTFQATLAEPLVVDGLVVAERGARVAGRVGDSKTSGRFSGTSVLELSLTSFQTADGQRIAIVTDPWAKQSEPNDRSKNDAARIGGGAALGAIIGAIAGGGKGAAIGAGVGGGAGAGSVAAQRPKALEIPSETLIRFRLASRVVITERPL